MWGQYTSLTNTAYTAVTLHITILLHQALLRWKPFQSELSFFLFFTNWCKIYWKNMDTASNTHWGSWSERKIFLPYLKLFFLQPLWPGAVVCSSLVWRNFLLKNIKWLKAQNKGLQNLSINFLENWLWPLAACWIGILTIKAYANLR